MDTLEQFLEKLRETPRDWRLTSIGRIRNKHGFCPLYVVYGGWGSDKVLLFPDVRDGVLITADYQFGDSTYDENLRWKLLDACGL